DRARRQYAVGLSTERRAPMTTGVVEASQDHALIPHQQNALVAELKGAERTRCPNAAGPSDVDPISEPDPLQVPLIQLRVEIGFSRQPDGVLRQAVVMIWNRDSSESHV